MSKTRSKGGRPNDISAFVGLEPPPILVAIWAEAKRNGTNKLTMRQIDAEIRKARRTKSKGHKDSLKQQLKKGASARSQRDKAFAADWFDLDAEA